MPSKLLSKTRLIRDIYLAIQTYLLWTDIAPIALSYHIFGHIKFNLFTVQSHVTAHQRDSQAVMSITQTSCIEFNAKFSNCYISVIS